MTKTTYQAGGTVEPGGATGSPVLQGGQGNKSSHGLKVYQSPPSMIDHAGGPPSPEVKQQALEGPVRARIPAQAETNSPSVPRLT